MDSPHRYFVTISTARQGEKLAGVGELHLL